ncbi:MAG: radical SAM protein [Thermodesulfobacteriota bacterium]|nr:radical SAM protein [Thermodesulfobacteriota bacterium]
MKRSVVLINPPLSLEDRYGKDMKEFGAVSEPLGIAYIAGYLESQDIHVRVIDAQAENLSDNDIVNDISERKDEIIGISMLTPSFHVVKRLCKQLKGGCQNSMIILGGPHCTVLPERTLHEIKEADVTCIGEGELTLAEIAGLDNGLHLGGIKGICYREGDKIMRTEARPFIKDLDRIPPPARHLLPMEKYHLTASRVSESSYCPTIVVARGCPFSCTFCSRTFGSTLRTHSVDRIVEEVKSLISTYRVSQINIEADTLTANKKFLKELCYGFIDSGINKRIQWTCESRVDTVDEEHLQLMYEAGCWQISYGVETGSQRLLNLINKSVNLRQIEDIFRLTKKVGISIRGFFMLGLPTETREESYDTIRFAKKLDPLWAQFTLTVPYPGTKMFNELDKMGQITTYDWSKYNTWSGWKGAEYVPFVPQGRTVEELCDLQKKALREFYLRPVVIIRFIAGLHSLHDFKKYLMGFFVLIRSKFNKRLSKKQGL